MSGINIISWDYAYGANVCDVGPITDEDLHVSGVLAVCNLLDAYDDVHWSRHELDTSFSGWLVHGRLLHRDDVEYGRVPVPMDNVPESAWRQDALIDDVDEIDCDTPAYAVDEATQAEWLANHGTIGYYVVEE